VNLSTVCATLLRDSKTRRRIATTHCRCARLMRGERLRTCCTSRNTLAGRWSTCRGFRGMRRYGWRCRSRCRNRLWTWWRRDRSRCHGLTNDACGCIYLCRFKDKANSGACTLAVSSERSPRHERNRSQTGTIDRQRAEKGDSVAYSQVVSGFHGVHFSWSACLGSTSLLLRLVYL
jgi:hypothetical protein